MMESLFYILSGEWLLKCRPNGGSVIFLRSLLVSLLIYMFAIGIQSYARENSIFRFCSDQLWLEISSTVPWLGAIFAATYAAFYTRFSSQWNYLANLYNQIMVTRISIENRFDPAGNKIESEELVHWEAAFIEDAIDLHLATKSMFSPFISQLLKEENVKAAFLESATDGRNKLDNLSSQLTKMATK